MPRSKSLDYVVYCPEPRVTPFGSREKVRPAYMLEHVGDVSLMHGSESRFSFTRSFPGGSRDFGAAVAWFRLAATEGHVEAMWLLGRWV